MCLRSPPLVRSLPNKLPYASACAPAFATFPGVTSSDLTPEQRRRLVDLVQRHAVFIHWVVRRMEAVGMGGDDRLYNRARSASFAILDLVEAARTIDDPRAKAPLSGLPY